MRIGKDWMPACAGMTGYNTRWKPQKEGSHGVILAPF
jgi:hypothetical protein